VNQRTLNQVVLFSTGGADMFPGGPYYVEFVTTSSTGAAVNADSTPTVTMNHNGSDDGTFSITVTALDTGRYKGTGTVPASYLPGDYVWASVAATIGGVAAKAVADKFVVGSPGYARVGTAQAGSTASTLKLDASASATDNLYNDQTAFIYSGTGAGQTATILSYVGSTKVATIMPNWRTTPDATSLYAILPASRSDLGAVLGTAGLSPIVNAVLDEVNTGATHNVNNSVGKQIRTSSGGNTSAIYTGTAPSQAGMTTTQIKLDAGASSVSQVYRYNVISILSGTDAGDSAVILDYNGATKIATVDDAWSVQPDATSVFEITPGAKCLVIDKTGFSLSATGLSLIPAGALNGLGDWLKTLGANAPSGWINSAAIAAGALNGKGDWLAGLGTTAPAGWINSAAIAAGALNGKGDWSTYAGSDTPGTSILLGRIGSAITINGGAVAIDWNHIANPASTVNLSGTTIAGSGGGSGLTAADVWAYVDRTLTDLPPLPAGWIDAAGIAPAALNGKGDWLTPSGTLAHVAEVDTVSDLTDKTGFSLSAAGLNAISVTDPGGVAATWPQMLVAIWRLWFKGSSKTVSDLTIKTYADDGTTVRTTQNYTDDGAGNQTRSAAS
jgi:hypothetical protein